MLPVVSVVIPTYNHAEYVLETLGSVFAQTFTDFEVLVVNDGSPDDTAQRLRPLVADGRIRYFEQSNLGQSSARNRGLAEARGEFVALLDDDDLWPSDKLAWQVDALRVHPDWTTVGGPAEIIEIDGSRGDGGSRAEQPVLWSVADLFGGNPMRSPGQSLVRRAALEAIGGLDPKIWGSDDWDLWMRLVAQGPLAMMNRCALYYRMHTTNASHQASRMFWSGVQVVRKNLSLVPPALRTRALSDGLRSLYDYSGSRAVNAARGGGIEKKWTAFGILAYLAGPSLRDRALARMVGRDTVPEFVQRMLRGRRSQPFN